MRFIKLFLLFILLFALTGCTPYTENVNHNAENAAAPVKTSANKNITASKNIEQEIGTFTTTIYTKTSERQHNLELTSSILNGHIVRAGEEFSFCNLIGRSTPDKGYLEAEIFDSKGNKKKGYGGGNCQVSSTLFNAVTTVPGLEVLERHNHSNKVPYIETGKDAAVFYGAYDFRFKNNNQFDIKIVAHPTKDELTIKIFKIRFLNLFFNYFF